MATIRFTVERSEWFVRNERLATGENVPQDIDVTANVIDLSPETRQILLACGDGEYQTSFRIECELCKPMVFKHLEIDSNNPTPRELDLAVAAVYRTFQDYKRDKANQERKARQLENDKQRARELIKDEIAKLHATIAHKAACIHTLSQFASSADAETMGTMLSAMRDNYLPSKTPIDEVWKIVNGASVCILEKPE